VAPVLIALMLFTADMYSRGSLLALALPFAMGLGMALPWPLVGAGMKVLPRPGSWMKWVNRVFAVVVFGFSAWYAHLAYVGFAGNEARDEKAGGLERTVENFTLDGLERPVLVDCWASWCKNCKAMDEIVARPAVAQELKKFTFVKLQAEDISKLVRMPGFEKIKGLPAFVIFR
jgi:thiol:disulfide interchange protein